MPLRKVGVRAARSAAADKWLPLQDSLFSANPPPDHVAGRKLEKRGTRVKAIGSQVSMATRLCWGDEHMKRTLEIFAAQAGDTEQHGEEEEGKQPGGK